MTPRSSIPNVNRWERILYFFPIQLLFVHLKKDIILLTIWLILFAITTGSVGVKYGVPYLFLFPEYLGSVSLLSHFIVGIAVGGFIMSFNIASYIVNGFRFPFLATLNRPFIKYCQNNFIIPLAYSLVYVVFLIQFQFQHENSNAISIGLNVLGFLGGNITFIMVTGLYFALTNKNLFHFLPQREAKADDEHINPMQDLFGPQNKWEYEKAKNRKEWKVTTYISQFSKIRLARDSSHYDRATLERVFSQNRINASYFQAAIIVALFVLGIFHQYDFMMIPAAASVLLFFTMIVMLASAFYSWFKGWTSFIVIAVLVSLNFLSTKSAKIYKNQAYGLDYDTEMAEYTQESISALQSNSQNLFLDMEREIHHLENWKTSTGEEKPYAVFINVPGGGLRSAVWTIKSLSVANDSTKGKLWKNAILLSGSSGGMIGVAYLREYMWRQKQGLVGNIDLGTDMALDKLNPVASTAVLNDIFFRFKTFEYDGFTYTKDRAFAFENKLNLDTRGWLNRRLSDYRDLEHNAQMPMLLLAPTISDDGRKLLISSQPISYLTSTGSAKELNENVEFTRLFEHQKADNLNFITALRMSATFPYVFPSANLPTKPGIEILDAGIRDNYGMSNTLKYIFAFKEWLQTNTSGIVIIQVRDQKKVNEADQSNAPSILEAITQPLGTFYNTILVVQDYQMEDQLKLARDWYNDDIIVEELVLDRSKDNPISLSWHLTSLEKNRITDALTTPHNLGVYSSLKELFGE